MRPALPDANAQTANRNFKFVSENSLIKFDNALTAQIIEFLRGIDIEIKFSPIDEPTVLPGMTITGGAIVVDEAKLKYPGDLLHEAGHLAVLPPEKRKLDDKIGKKAYEEMAAIAWSYAALVHLNLEPSVVFHIDGYRGGSQNIIDNFTQGNYFGVPILQWLGLTNESKADSSDEAVVYPKMIKWLAE